MKTDEKVYKLFKCPTCGRGLTSPIPIYSATCTGDAKKPPHKRVEMKPVE